MNIGTINIITLAYIGDAIYEVYIRDNLIRKGIVKVEELQKHAIRYVSAKGQKEILTKLMDKRVLTEEEIDIVKRGRNNKRTNHPKNTDIITYKQATGFEALIGYLYLEKKYDRLKEIFKYIEVM